MSMIVGRLRNPDEVEVEVTITSKLKEWRALRKFIVKHKDELTGEMGNYGGLDEPFWSIVHRLGDVIGAIEKQHTNYEPEKSA